MISSGRSIRRQKTPNNGGLTQWRAGACVFTCTSACNDTSFLRSVRGRKEGEDASLRLVGNRLDPVQHYLNRRGRYPEMIGRYGHESTFGMKGGSVKYAVLWGGPRVKTPNYV